MFDYEELDGIVGCFCTLVNPRKGQREGTIVADWGNEVVVQLVSGREIVECKDDVVIYD